MTVSFSRESFLFVDDTFKGWWQLRLKVQKHQEGNHLTYLRGMCWAPNSCIRGTEKLFHALRLPLVVVAEQIKTVIR